jgi:hypothetical protein
MTNDHKLIDNQTSKMSSKDHQEVIKNINDDKNPNRNSSDDAMMTK